MEEIEIDGIRYQKKEKPQSKRGHGRMSPRLMGILLMAEMAMPSNYYGVSRKKRELPDVNLIEEYGLIQQKKSKLSRSQRELVVHVFKENFEVI